jgi:hypothetical protein
MSRTFGVELEFRGPSDGNLMNAGVMVNYGSRDAAFRRLMNTKPLFNDFRLGYDGSEFELKTPILRGEKGFNRLRDACRYLKDWGCATTRSDGLHVHHGASPDYKRGQVINRENVIKLLESWIINQEEIMKMCHPSRTNNYACPLWSPTNLQQLKNNSDEYGSNIYPPSRWGTGFGRRNLNISALYRHGTIEFRCHEGTIEEDAVISWVRFGQKFLNSVSKRKNSIPQTQVDLLLSRVKVSKNASRYLVTKYRNGGVYRAPSPELVSVA